MAKNMTVGKRIVLGFTVVIAIAIAIGGLGVWNMRAAESDSTKLAQEYVPEVKVATDLRGAANRVMYQMRGFGLSEEQKFYDAAQKELATLKAHATEAEDLAARAVYLKALKGQVEEVNSAVSEYGKLMEATDQTIAAMNEERQKLDKNAATYMENCTAFLEGQNAAFKKDLDERQRKVAIVTDIVNVGTKVRVTNFKAQASQNMALMQEAVDLLAGLKEYTGELRPITRDPADIERIDATEAAAQRYAENMTAYIEASRSLADASSRMDAGAAAYMKNCEDFLESQNEKIQQEFKQEGANLSERLRKITMVNAITEMGNTARIKNFKGQANQDPVLIQEAADVMAGVTKLTGDLRAITKQANNLTQIDNIETAAAEYGGAINDYLKTYNSLADLRKEMDDAAGDYVQQCAAFLAGQQEKLTKDMHERHEKITLVNDIVDLGNDSRIKAFKSQALRSPEIMQAAIKNFPVLDQKYEALRKITRLDADLQRIQTTKEAGDTYAATLTSFLEQWRNLQSLGSQREEAGQRVITACKTTADAGMTTTDELSTNAAESLSQNAGIMTIGLIVGTIVAIVCALWIVRSITGPLNRIIAGLNEGADQVNDAAAQVAGASQQLAEGASEQASSLEETSSALEEMAAMTRTNAENAKEANTLSGQARDAAKNGDSTMKQLNGAMTAINESSNEISKIIKVIEEIAFQTNLLALNAAVEAARAGEHGKGFAVVADEVRNLAQRAAQAAGETTSLIEDSVTKAREGTGVAGEVGKALAAIVGDVTRVTDLINGIAQASQEQAQGVDQVNTAVSQMDKVTQQNASGAEESAAAAEQLSAQAQAVKGIVDELASLIGGDRVRKSVGLVSKTSTKPTAKQPQKAPALVHASAPVASVGAPAGAHPGAQHAGGSAAEEFLSMESDSEMSSF